MAAQNHLIETLFKQTLEQGDSASFEALFKSQYGQLCSFATRYLQNAEAAEEAVSEVFYKIWKNRAQINIKTSAKYYLYASVRNMAIDMQRQSKKQLHSSDDCLHDHAHPGPDAYEAHLAEKLNKNSTLLSCVYHHNAARYFNLAAWRASNTRKSPTNWAFPSKR